MGSVRRLIRKFVFPYQLPVLSGREAHSIAPREKTTFVRERNFVHYATRSGKSAFSLRWKMSANFSKPARVG